MTPPSQQRRECGSVVTEIVEQGTYVRIGSRQDREPITRTDSGQHQQPCRKFQHGGLQVSLSRTSTQPTGILRESGRQSGNGLRFESGTRRVLDGKPVAAQQEGGFHAVAFGEAPNYITQLSHPGWLHRKETSATYEPLPSKSRK
jgi:hypothetical protein